MAPRLETSGLIFFRISQCIRLSNNSRGSALNILHSSTDPTLLARLQEMLGSSARADIAVGYFFIGGFGAVSDKLARLDKVRILVGRTDRQVLEEVALGLQQKPSPACPAGRRCSGAARPVKPDSSGDRRPRCGGRGRAPTGASGGGSRHYASGPGGSRQI